MLSNCEVVIVGAGPYGLSIAAHLAGRNVPFRIFGTPMQGWRAQMPKGMLLKSEGFASSLIDPEGRFPLAAFCAERGLPYRDVGLPVPIETFIEYGLAFQRRFAPEVDQRLVESVSRAGTGFVVRLADGASVGARLVVVAVGVGNFAHMPAELAALPATHLTHSSAHAALDEFSGRQVIVVGAGASAVDLAALLRRAGAEVRLLARRTRIDFHEPPRQRSLFERLRAPRSGLGLGWGSRLATDLPLVFHVMPEAFRLRTVRRHLGPAPGWFVREEVEGRVPMTLGATLKGVSLRNGRVQVAVVTTAGDATLEADHVIAATGYQVDLRRLPFLPADILGTIRMVEHSPILSARFESSLPGLFFVGPAAANSFGPLMRFGYGAAFVCRQVTPHLERLVRRARATTAAAPVQAGAPARAVS